MANVSCFPDSQPPALEYRPTFLGRRRVTRVMPWTRVRCSFSMALRAFSSLREWITAEEPAGRPESAPSSPDSSLLSSSSSTVGLLTSSSGSSSTLGLAILEARNSLISHNARTKVSLLPESSWQLQYSTHRRAGKNGGEIGASAAKISTRLTLV